MTSNKKSETLINTVRKVVSNNGLYISGKRKIPATWNQVVAAQDALDELEVRLGVRERDEDE